MTDIRVIEIQREVARAFGVSVETLMSRRKHRTAVVPRQVAMYLAKVMTHWSFPEIGRMFERDHTTVMSAVKVIEGRFRHEPDFAGTVDDIARAIDATGIGWERGGAAIDADEAARRMLAKQVRKVKCGGGGGKLTGRKDQLLDALAVIFGETSIGRTMDSQGFAVEVLISAGGESWSLVALSDDEATARLIASGFKWPMRGTDDAAPPVSPPGLRVIK